MKLVQFKDVKIGDVFYKWETTDSIPYVKTVVHRCEDGLPFNCYDDNTGEMFFINQDRMVYLFS
jgi:hypothetical protein